MRAVALTLFAATVVAVAAGCGGAAEKAVAHVGATKVMREQLEQTVEHFREEARREGKPFPAGAAARKQLLGLLVFRAQLAAGAAALGVKVDDRAVERRVEASAGGDEGSGKDARAFAESSVRAQLLEEAVYRKLARRVHLSDPQAAQAARNAALEHWLAALPKRYPVR